MLRAGEARLFSRTIADAMRSRGHEDEPPPAIPQPGHRVRTPADRQHDRLDAPASLGSQHDARRALCGHAAARASAAASAASAASGAQHHAGTTATARIHRDIERHATVL
jgi:hypothetical protein